MDISGYSHPDATLAHTARYLLPTVLKALDIGVSEGLARRIFELGCGSGGVANRLTTLGYEVVGVDPSVKGVAMANQTFPRLRVERASSEDDLAARYGRYPFVISLEVVEHVYAPRRFARCVYELLDESGMAIISTPYHGYLKNLTLALSGKLDAHFTALWDCGHIKFWSISTLRTLLLEAGFRSVRFERVGRVPPLAMSMIAIARR
jgi:2-polyprenyl-6-hydroxyphenyl methylase/3-demethylubiquinone-9 3-methyltransferase